MAVFVKFALAEFTLNIMANVPMNTVGVANRVLGNWRTAVVCVAGHVIGTLVSEGIVDARVTHGLLPASDTRILDVGPCYIVVSAIAVAVLYGSWLARLAAALDLVALVFVRHIFSGLSRLDVTA